MQNDLDTNYPQLAIQILGVNDVGHELSNPTITAGRYIPWLQDVDDNNDNLSDIRFNLWDAGYRDVIILDKENIEVGRFNLTDNDLAVAENYNTLRQMLIFAANNSPESVGQLDTSLVLSPTTTDADGEVATLPSDAETLLEWQTFSYEIWVSTPESVNFGVTSASAVIAYNSDFFTPDAIIEFGPAFSTTYSSSIDDSTGQINVSATASQEGAGADAYVLLARITFDAVVEGPGAPIDLAGSEYISPVGQPWIELVENDNIAVELFDIGSVEVEIGAPTTTALYPVMYDLDDDGKVGIGDMSSLSSVFLSNANSSALAMKADFDHSGMVNFGDLSYFSANFLKSRSGREPIISPLSFPDQFIAAAAASSSYSPICVCIEDSEPEPSPAESPLLPIVVPVGHSPQTLPVTAHSDPQEASLLQSDDEKIAPREVADLLVEKLIHENLLDDFFGSLGG